MADYKQMYLTLLDAAEKVVNTLIAVQRECEEIYIRSSDDENVIQESSDT